MTRSLLVLVLAVASGHARDAENPQRAHRGIVTATVVGTDVPLTPSEIKDAFHDPKAVMAEVQRLQTLGLNDAVQAIVEGTTKLAVGHTVSSTVISELADSFTSAMQGHTFLEVSDSPRAESVRYRRALYVAACASLSAEARSRADSMPN